MTSVTEEFDRLLRSLKAAQRRSGIHAAALEGQRKRECEALLDQVDQTRRDAYAKAIRG